MTGRCRGSGPTPATRRPCRLGLGGVERQELELAHRRGGARGCLCRRVRGVVVVGDDPLGDGLVKVGERVGAVDHLDE